MRSASQCRRLAFEEAVLRQEMPQVQFYNKSTECNTYVEGAFGAAGTWQDYILRASIPLGYPDAMPALLAVSPHTLARYGGGTINALGATHEFHTGFNGPGGCVSICHSKPENWDASKTLLGIFLKGALWVSAHQAHLATGRPICDFVLTDQAQWQPSLQLNGVDFGVLQPARITQPLQVSQEFYIPPTWRFP